MGSLAPEAESTHHLDSFVALGLSESGKRDSEFPRVISLLSSIIERTVQMSEGLHDPASEKEAITVFHGLRAPELAVRSYVERVFKYSKCSPSCFVLAHVYIDRYLQRQRGVRLTCLNVHRLLMTSVVIAAKFIDDSFFNNAYYARVGGVSTQELNRLEINLLFSLDFRLQVNIGTFGSYCVQLEKEATGYQVERPVQVRARKECIKTKIDDSKCQPALQRCSCGTV